MINPAQNQNPTTALFGEKTRTEALVAAAWILALVLAKGRSLDQRVLRNTLQDAFGASDAEGAWTWKDAYEAAELAQIIYLRRHASTLIAPQIDPAQTLAVLSDIARLAPSQTRRSEDQVRFQQFSTPLDYAFAASVALDPRPTDVVLEPSAGTGLLAVFAEIAGSKVHLNELDPARAELLDTLFRENPVTRFNAEQIHDRLPATIQPTLVFMNPPFSTSPNVVGRHSGVDLKHIRAAFRRLAEGGRLVAITGPGLAPERDPEGFSRLAEMGAQVVFSGAVAERAYARNGVAIETRVLVADKVREAANPVTASETLSLDVHDLLIRLQAVSPRRRVEQKIINTAPRSVLHRPTLHKTPKAVLTTASSFKDPISLDYVACTPSPSAADDFSGIYEAYAVDTVRIPGAKSHPSSLVQSVAMAAVSLPRATYRPVLPRAVIEDGLLSDAQLETDIYAGQAHSEMLPGYWLVDETYDQLTAADEDNDEAVQFRQGFFLGDGTGAGKGRQAASVVLDNWLQGRRRALWISKSELLVQDARRDWTALGGHDSQVIPQSRFKLGDKIGLKEGILFTTYATARTSAREGKESRLDQIIGYLGRDFDGVIILDEGHALANAAGEKGARGAKGPSEQGIMGLRLQNALPLARVVYVSATGATVVSNLGYATRLGLWGGASFPFPTRASFVAAMEAGGVAAMEVLARDLKALGLYTSRSLSYDGVEYELAEHELTDEQVTMYDAYAEAFRTIHSNLEAALEATGITGEEGETLNGAAKSAARSAFESTKQRFFGAILCAMKVPTIIKKIDQGLEAGFSPVIQLVSTGEAITDRRLSDIPVCEWNDLQVDVTPREYVLDYLYHSFPTTLFEPYSDDEGNMRSRPVVEGGSVVECQDALIRRDAMIEYLGALPPLQAALDQLVQHYGDDRIAEVTGRSRRIVKRNDVAGSRLCVQRRPASSNKSETDAFMDGKKDILVFSDAGGTGRSYHADRGVKNKRRRLHLLLEPGWRADVAVQGLGRTNRTNQDSAPLFMPIATNVKGEIHAAMHLITGGQVNWTAMAN